MHFLIPLIQTILLVIGNKRSTTWFIDGNNLIAQRGTPKDRKGVIQQLQKVSSSTDATDEIVLVFDGYRQKEIQESSISTLISKDNHESIIMNQNNNNKDTIVVQDENSKLRTVALGEGLSADDYIRQEIRELASLISDGDATSTRFRKTIQLVSADRELRYTVSSIGPMVRSPVNPVTFWKRYLPRLGDLK